jgi:hypothetical protein
MNLDGKCVAQCNGCDFQVEDRCEVFLCPEAKFRTGRGISCGMATHLIVRVVEDTGKKRAGQQKTKQQKSIMK